MKDGFSPQGKQRYRCRGCGKRSRENSWSIPADREAQVLTLANERMSQRGISRALGISRVTVVEILKKDDLILLGQSDSGVSYPENTLLPAQAEDVLELDEVWSYIGVSGIECGFGWPIAAEPVKLWRGGMALGRPSVVDGFGAKSPKLIGIASVIATCGKLILRFCPLNSANLVTKLTAKLTIHPKGTRTLQFDAKTESGAPRL